MNRLKLFAGSFIIFSAVLLGLQSNARAYNINEYFPMGQEDYWVYADVDGEEGYDIEIIDGTEIIDEVTTIRKEQGDNFDCLAWDLEGLRWYKQDFENNEYMIFDTPVLLFLTQMEIGQQVTASATFSSYRDGQVYRTGSADLTRTLAALEEVTVPAGTFANCLKFTEEVSWQHSDGDSGSYERTLWLAQGVGEVGSIRIITMSEGGNTYTETEERELVFANVDGNTYGQNVVGRIAGHVYRIDKITPIDGAVIEIFKINRGRADTQALTAADGSYSFFLPEGDYTARASAADYAREYYDNVTPSHEASVVHVSPGSDINIEFDLNEGGAISGLIYDSETGNPVTGAEVFVHPSRYQNDAGFRVLTEADGSYTVGGLALGDYAVRVQAAGYISEYFGGSYNYWSDLPPVRIIPPDTIPNINIYIEKGGSVSGYVYDNNGLPLDDVHVLAQGRTVEGGAGTSTDSSGHYLIEGLPAGGFFVRVYGPSLPLGLAPEHYDGIYRHGEGDIVDVQKGLDTSGINFTLEPGGAISGHVYDEETGVPLSGIGLFAYLMEDGRLVMTASEAWTDAFGYYYFNTSPESHIVGVSWGHVGHNRGYLAELYNDVLAGADPWSDPGPVTLIDVQANQETTDIDFSLQKGGSISGYIYEEDGVTPIAGANIYAFPEDPQILGSGASSQPDGSYKIECLFSGSYTVQVTVSDYNSASVEAVVSSPGETSGIEFLLTEAESELSEENSIESTLVETVVSQQFHLSNLEITGDLGGAISFSDLEAANIATGQFAGQGFYKGVCQLDLGDLSYTGEWAGVFFPKPEEGKIYLNGAVFGGIRATTEGYLTESVPGSGNYDQYQATWKIGALGGSIISATVEITGALGYDSRDEFPDTELYVLQTNFEGTISGHYAGPLSTVMTHLRVVTPANPYYEEGFSIISYTSESGSGTFWTYDKSVSEGIVELKGLSTSPLFGIVSATLDESEDPRVLTVENIERIDLGLPPATDLKVKVFGLRRISPGQTVDYVVEYRNDGLKDAENSTITVWPTLLSNFISASPGATYYDDLRVVEWESINIPAKTHGFLTVKVEIIWGLPENTILCNQAGIHASPEEVKPPIEFLEKIFGYRAGRRMKDLIFFITQELLGKAPPPFNAYFGTMTMEVIKAIYPTFELVEVTIWLEDKIIASEPGNEDGFWRECFSYLQAENLSDKPFTEFLEEVNGIAERWQYSLTDEEIRDFLAKINVAIDPNIKYGPEGDVAAGQKLDYRVEYENEGDGIAFGVYFTDTMDEDLDDLTLEVGPVISTIDGTEIAPAGTYNPATRTITWLVGEVGPGEGGYSDLSAEVRSDAQPGTEIINFATVYFPSVPEATRTNGIVSTIPIVSENNPPVADAGPDQTVVVGTDGMVEVTLDGSASYDPDEDSLTYTWRWDGGSATGVSPTIQLEKGDYTITLVVNDGTDNSEPDIVYISAIDITPPEISLSVSPDMLWPPNHKMVLITPIVVATDNCDPDHGITLQSIAMNEGDWSDTYDSNFDLTNEDGHTTDDIEIDENGDIYLRAERAGKSNGRVYTITYLATDSSGNSATASATVTVPHDMR